MLNSTQKIATTPTATIKFFKLPGKVFLRSILPLLVSLLFIQVSKGQIAAWDFTGLSSPVTAAATTYNTNLVSTVSAKNMTRGAGASASSASNCFRTQGFQNDGVTLANTDYFQITLTAATGYKLSLSTIDARFNGSNTYFANAGVTSQFAYSVNGTSFILIGSPIQITSANLTIPSIDLSGITALQNVAAGTTVRLRYFASGQTTTGGWGFQSNGAAGSNGLAIGGAVTPAVSNYTLTYSGNGNTDGVAPLDANSPYASGSNTTVLAAGNLIRAGYTFAGWNTAADGNGTSYAAGDPLSNITANTTLYAKWSINSYTITYDANTGSGTVPVDTDNPYEYGTNVTVLDAANLTKPGYTFIGWNTVAGGGMGGTAYTAGNIINSIGANLTLYAQWLQDDRYTVTYDGNGSDAGSPVPLDNSSPYIMGSDVAVLGPGSLVNTGYTFTGWNTAANGIDGTAYNTGATITGIAASVVLYAQWSINTYTVTYDGNGSDGGTLPTDPASPYNYNSSVIVLDAGTLTRTNYIFTGWNSAANGGGTTYAPEAIIADITTDIILYAQWSLITYTVTYNGNGSTAGAVPVDGSNPHAIGSDVSVLGVGALVRTGYSFTGWNTAANGSGTAYAAGATISGISASTILYAQWSINTYTVTYNGNGNTGGIAPVDANSPHNYNTLVNVLANTGNLVKAAATFSGWNTLADGTGTNYAATGSATFTIGTANVILYAKWVIPSVFTENMGTPSGTTAIAVNTFQNSGVFAYSGSGDVRLTTPSNGYAGASGSGNVFITSTSGTNFQIGSISVVGYTNLLLSFGAYKSTPGSDMSDLVLEYSINGTNYFPISFPAQPTGTGTNAWRMISNVAIPAGANSAANLRLRWKQTGTATQFRIDDITLAGSLSYSLTYSGNGNTAGTAPVDANSPYAPGSNTTVLGAGTLGRTGYTFAGWNTLANGTGTSYAAGDPLTNITANTTLYARWSINSYTITYDANTGSGSVPVDENNPYEFGSGVTVLDAGSLTRLGYTFNGWNTVANGIGGTAYAAGDIISSIAANLTLYAQWIQDNTYAVTYNGNGSDDGSPVPVDDSSPYAGGTDVTVLGPGTLTRTGYTFVGWNTAFNGLGAAYSPGSAIPDIAVSVILYAQWSVNTYTVTYEGNGSDGGTVPTDPASPYNYNSNITVLDAATLTRTNYTFAGWNTAANGGGTPYSGGAIISGIAANITLYAQWTLLTYTVTYNRNGGTGTPPVDADNPHTSGSDVTILGVGSLVRTGYSFAGWNTAANGSGTAYSAGSTLTAIASNTILYAQWSINSYTVTYSGNGNTGGGVPVDGDNPYEYNSLVTVLANSGGLTQTGAIFVGWNTAADGTGLGYAATGSATFTIGAANVVLYARWEATFYEGFGYTAGTFIGSNSTAASGGVSNNWTTHSNTNGNSGTINVGAGSLSYPGLKLSTGNKITLPGTSAAVPRDVNRAITFASTSIVYYSFLLNVAASTPLSTGGDYFTGFGGTSGNNVSALFARVYIKSVNTGANFRLAISNGTVTATDFATDLVFGTTYLVVVKHDLNGAQNDISTLWVNPASLSGTEPAGSVSNNVSTTGQTTFASIFLRNGNSTPNADIDEMRVGITWAEVTPMAVVTTTWQGADGADWNVAGNWSNGVPGTGMNVVINNGYPVMNVDYTLPAGKTLAISGTGGLVIGAGKTFTVNGTADFGGKSVTIQSTAVGTGAIGQIAGNGANLTGASDVTAERYIPNNDFRSWRLLSVPTSSSQTIREAWQEGLINPAPMDNNLAGFGTQITGTGAVLTAQNAGFDNVAQRPALLSYDGTAFNGVATTNAPIQTTAGYFLYIRGERSKGVSGVITNSSATTLRTKGTLYKGNVQSTIPPNRFGLIGNVYPSAIAFDQLTISGGVKDLFYIWDAKKESDGSLGVYQTFNGTNGYLCPISGGSYIQNEPNKVIESGQAFFVETDGASGTVLLTEGSKIATPSGSLGFRPVNPAELVKIDSRLRTANGTVADANVVVFDNVYPNTVGREDASKMANNGENFGIDQSGKVLAIEGRQVIGTRDTIFFNMWNMKQQAYQLEFVPNRLAGTGLIALLEDTYLHTSTPVSLDANNTVDFAVDANAASSATNRFRLVFEQARPLPVGSFTSVSANRTGNAVKVDWKVAAERDIRKYEVERSIDGRNFLAAGSVQAMGNAAEIDYSFTDINAGSGTIFYRVKTVGLNGNIQYSSTVKVAAGNAKPGFTVSPNPVENGVVNLQLTDQVAGRYTIRIVSITGVTLFTGVINHAGGSGTRLLTMPSKVSAGTYQLDIIAPDNGRTVNKIVFGSVQ